MESETSTHAKVQQLSAMLSQTANKGLVVPAAFALGLRPLCPVRLGKEENLRCF